MCIVVPVYIPDEPIRFFPSGSTVVVDWSLSFEVNGPVIMYVLYKDNEVEYAGTDTQYAVLRDTRTAG